MTKKRSIYIITTGDYSSYRIVAVFDDRKLANSFAKLESGLRVESYEINLYEQQIREGLKCYRVDMDRHGDGKVFQCDPDGYPLSHNYKNSDSPFRLWGYVWAIDEQHALKIAGEKRAVLIATGEWK